MLLVIITFKLVVALSLTKMDGKQVSNNLTSCQRSRILIIWDTSSGEDSSFIQQTRLVISLINDVTNGTEILLTTVGTSLKNLIHINKTSTDTSWRGIISSHKPDNLTNRIIPHSSISKAVFTFLTQVRSQKIAEEIVFVVNKKSDIDNIGKVKEVLTYKIVFVVFVGISPLLERWANVATDRQHLFKLSDSVNASVKPVAEGMLVLCCKDSRLVCDTDEYWTGKICNKCSHICSIDTNNLSEKNLEDCRYFASCQYAKGAQALHATCKQTFLNTVQTPMLICILVILIFYFVYKRCRRKCVRSCNGARQRENQRQNEEESDHMVTSLSSPPNRNDRREDDFNENVPLLNCYVVNLPHPTDQESTC